MEMGLHISLKMHFLHSHQCFLENLDAMSYSQGENYSSYGSKMPGVLKRINDIRLLDVASWLFSHAF